MNLKDGEIIKVGNKLFGRCARCKKIVRINKPLIGDLHICEEENGQIKKDRVLYIK